MGLAIPDIIADLFNKELGGNKWKKYKTKDILNMIEVSYPTNKSRTEWNLFLKKIPETLPIEETLSILTDELMGKMQ